MIDFSTINVPPPELIITLDAPIARKGGGEVTELILSEPTASQVRAAEGHLRGGVNPESIRLYQLSLVTSVSKVSKEVIDQLPILKLLEAADYIQDFITPRPATGAN